MKILVAIFVLLDFLLACRAAAENATIVVEPPTSWTALESPFGNCSAREIWNIYTTCTTPLIHGIQKKKACMPLVKQAIKCRFNLYNKTKCFKVDDIHGDINVLLNGTAEGFCEKAGLIELPTYQIEKVKGGTRYSFPCSISTDKYKEEFKRCNSKMLGIWKNNTADPRICREFYNTKQCKKQLLDTKCNYTGETKTSIDLAYAPGSYNPFCPGGVDITSGTAFSAPFGTIALAVMFLFAVLMSEQ